MFSVDAGGHILGWSMASPPYVLCDTKITYKAVYASIRFLLYFSAGVGGLYPHLVAP